MKKTTACQFLSTFKLSDTLILRVGGGGGGEENTE